MCFFLTAKHTSAWDMNYTVVVLGGVFILSLVWYYFPVSGGVVVLKDSCQCELLATFSHFNWLHLVKQ